MTTLPNNITRYTGANCFPAQDFHGNIFYVLQKQGDTGSVVMELPDGSAYEVLSMPAGSGRPCLEVNPLVGLWAVGNKETSTRTTPPRYPIAQYVPFPAGAPGPQGPQGVPGAGGITLFDAPYVSSEWSGRALAGGQLVDIPATFGVPSAPAYLVRLSGLASAPGVIVRAGTERAPYFVTLVTQVANIRVDTNGWIPGPVALISTVGGSAQTWLQIVGHS
jgi:hypothetical protein